MRPMFALALPVAIFAEMAQGSTHDFRTRWPIMTFANFVDQFCGRVKFRNRLRLIGISAKARASMRSISASLGSSVVSAV